MKKNFSFIILAFLLCFTVFDLTTTNSTVSAKGISFSYLSVQDKTNTTSRVTKKSGETLRYFVSVLREEVQFAIFKDGNMYITGKLGPGTHIDNISVPNGQYSLRVYCGSRDNQKTGCNVPSFYIEAY